MKTKPKPAKHAAAKFTGSEPGMHVIVHRSGIELGPATPRGRDGVGHRRRVVHWYERAIGVGYERLGSAASGAHDRAPNGKRLSRRQAERFVAAWAYADVRRRDPLGDDGAFHVTRQRDCIADA